MWATRAFCVVQADVELVGNPVPLGLSTNPYPRHIHSLQVLFSKRFKVLSPQVYINVVSLEKILNGG